MELSTHLINYAESLRRDIVSLWPTDVIKEGGKEDVAGLNEQDFDLLVMFWSR